jgi:hypothetical protein
MDTIEKVLANRFRQVLGCRSSRLRRHAKAHGRGPACRTSGAENRIQEMKSEIDRLPVLNLSDVCRSSTRSCLTDVRRSGLADNSIDIGDQRRVFDSFRKRLEIDEHIVSVMKVMALRIDLLGCDLFQVPRRRMPFGSETR